MPKDAHNKAAEHHENAAKSHRAAAEHHGKGEHAKGRDEFDEGPGPFEDRSRTFRHGARREPIAKVKHRELGGEVGSLIFPSASCCERRITEP